MHRCVCIWWYILQNYNYNLHFHVSIGTLAAENLNVCTACDPWDSNIQLTMGKDWRQQLYVGFVADIDIKILGVPPLPSPGAGHAFDRQQHMRRRGLFISARVFFPVWCHPWIEDETNGWMDEKLHKKWPRRPLLYAISLSLLEKRRDLTPTLLQEIFNKRRREIMPTYYGFKIIPIYYSFGREFRFFSLRIILLQSSGINCLCWAFIKRASKQAVEFMK
jgi:hypothetical protein